MEVIKDKTEILLAQVSDSQLQLGGLFNGLKVNVDKYKEIINDFNQLDFKNKKFIDSTTGKANWDAIAQAIEGCDKRALSYFKSLDDGNGTINNQSASVDGLGKHLNATGQSFTFAAVKSSLLNSALNAGIFLVASVAIQAVAKAIDNYTHRVENARKRTDELFREFEQMNDSLSDHKKTVAELADRYDELSKGVNPSNNQNISLSTDEYEEFLQINKQLADSFPSLAKGIDINGNSILSLGTKGITAKEQLEELLQTEEDLNHYKIAQELGDAFKGVYTYIEEADAATEKLNASVSNSDEAMKSLQKAAENGVKLNGENNQLLLAGNVSNQAELDYMNALTDSARQFWTSLDGARRVELSGFGIDDASLFRQEWDQSTGAFALYADAYHLTPDEIISLENMIKDNVSNVSGALLDSINDQSLNLQEQIQKGENAWHDFMPYLLSGMKSKQTFQDLDSEMQDIAVQIVESLDYSYASAMNEYDPDPYAYIRDKFIVPMGQLNDSDKKLVKDSFAELMSLDANDISEGNLEKITELINAIADALEKDPLELRIALGFDAVDDIKERMQNSIRQISDDHGMTDREQYAELANFTKDFTLSEAELWLEVTRGAENAAQAVEMYKAKLIELKTAAVPSPLSITDTISALNSTLPSALNSLSSAYQSIFTQDGFTLENVGLDMLDSIRTSIDRLNSMEGLRLNIDSSTFENFARVLTDTSSTASDVEAQFKSLNGTIIRAVGSAAVNPENFDVLSRSLEDLGYTNTQEVLTEIMQAQADFQAVSDRLGMSLEDAANATYQETVQLLINSKAALADKQALWQLAVAQGTITDGTIATESNVAALLAEAQAAGLDAATLTALENVKNGNIKDTNAAQAIMEQARQDIISSMSDFQLDFDLSGIGPAPSSLSHAGRSAGASYVDAFEKELDSLKESRDQGKITEKEYLDYLRKLYQHFFRDKKKYAKEYDKYEQEYLQGMKSLYESALSGITSILDKQINAYEDSKSAAVDSLEAERDARIEVLEAQKDQYEEQIKLIEKQIEEKESMIDGINEEIDAIREANEERQRQLTLQEKQIALERMLNQRSILQYSADKGMHYVQDTDGIRGARQELDDAKTEMVIADKEKQISLIEKEIDLLEDRKDSINEQIELIDTQIDQINSQYDKMISNTEKYWDGLISGMESYKSRWQELAEIEEQAKLVSMLEQLGLNADEILNMSEASFVRFKDEYMGILADIYADNSSMLAGLSEASGRSVEELGSYLQATQGYIDGLSGIGESLNPAAEAINNVDSSMSTLAGSASSVNEQTSGIASGMSDLGGSTAAVSDNLNSIKTALMELPEADKFLAIAEAFRYLAGALQYVSSVLGAAGEEGQGGLAAQFGSLKSAIDQVTSAIGGEIGNNTDTEGLPSSEIGGSQTNGAQGGASLSKAFSDLQKTAAKAIGKEGNEGDGTVIGTFGSLKGTITDVANTIGFSESEEEDGEKTGGDEDSASLTTSITGLQSTTEETLGDPGGNGVIGRFEQFKNVLGEASEHVQSIPKGLEDIDGKKVECTIKVTIETNGSLPEGIDGNMNLTSAEYNAEVNGSANAAGTALVTGSWAVQSAQRHTLVGELGRELIVRDGRFFTVGNYGAEFVDIQKGDIVFNHKQTEHLLKNGYITGRGKAYADGTIGDPLACGKYSPIHPYGYTAQLQKAFDPLVRRLLAGEEKIMNNAFAGEPGQMEKTIREMNASNIFDKSTHPDVHVDGIHISCPGVTSTEVARQVGAELNHMFNGFHNYADQQSLIR